MGNEIMTVEELDKRLKELKGELSNHLDTIADELVEIFEDYSNSRLSSQYILELYLRWYKLLSAGDYEQLKLELKSEMAKHNVFYENI